VLPEDEQVRARHCRGAEQNEKPNSFAHHSPVSELASRTSGIISFLASGGQGLVVRR
jgi:hypothetical protein